MRVIIISCILILFIISVNSLWDSSNGDKVLLTDVASLTFTAGRQTKGKRSSSIPQLNCEGRACKTADIRAIQCKNVGDDGFNVDWKCEADLENYYKFGAVEVSCEGYAHSDDPYILRGSCGLYYELLYTEAGKREFENNSNYNYNYGNNYNNGYGNSRGNSSSELWKWLFFAFAGYLIYQSCIATPAPATGATGPRVDPPPPYPGSGGPGFNPGPGYGPGGGGGGYGPGGGGGGGGGGFGPKPGSSTYQSGPAPGTSSGPGFWSGAMLGGLAGALLGGGRRHSYGYNRYNRGWGTGGGFNRGWGGGGGMRFGGGGGGGMRFGGGGGGGSTSRSASGFGTTRRR